MVSDVCYRSSPFLNLSATSLSRTWYLLTIIYIVLLKTMYYVMTEYTSYYQVEIRFGSLILLPKFLLYSSN